MSSEMVHTLTVSTVRRARKNQGTPEKKSIARHRILGARSTMRERVAPLRRKTARNSSGLDHGESRGELHPTDALSATIAISTSLQPAAIFGCS
jgi:hypothetical protein